MFFDQKYRDQGRVFFKKTFVLHETHLPDAKFLFGRFLCMHTEELNENIIIECV
jgi:hypothetical protein